MLNKELITGKGVAFTRELLKRFLGKEKTFITVRIREYAGYNAFLEGVIFGW